MAIYPPYPLQALVGIRERAKEKAEHQLGETMRALKVEQDRLVEMEQELERMIARREQKKREYMEKAMRGEMRAQGATASNVFIDRLKELEVQQQSAIEGQKGVIELKKKDVDNARQELVKATQDLKALEKHKEKWAEQIKKEVAAKEEEALDEIAQSGFMRQTHGDDQS